MSTEEWQGLALNNRRIPHGRLGKGGRSGRGIEFKPQSAFGTYDFQLKRSRNQTDEASGGSLEIHGFDDTEQGLQCSFRLGGIIQGVMFLAGSRKILKRVVTTAEYHAGEEEQDADKNPDLPGQRGRGLGPRDGEESDATRLDVEGSEGLPADYSESAAESSSVIDEDEQQNARAAAFEKNSFRSPKFWGRWRAQVKSGENETVMDENSAYLVFDKSNCSSFSGTLSSDRLGWKNVAVIGRKVKSSVAPALASWTDYHDQAQPPHNEMRNTRRNSQ